jgi:hypothetical protein
MTNSLRWISSFVAAAFFVPASPVLAEPPPPTPVTTCGQVVKGKSVLAGDLDCSAEISDAPTVLLENGTLDLAGFTITGRTLTGTGGDETFETVACGKNCAIVGPGTIVGSSVGKNAVVGFTDWENGNRIKVINATVSGGEFGVMARHVHMSGSTITGNRSTGIWAFFARVEGSTISGNGLGVDGIVRAGVFGQIKSRVETSNVTGNGMAGVLGWKLRIDDSTVTGNDAFADCGTRICADLAANLSLKVRGGSCDTSLRVEEAAINQPLPMGALPNWEVCTLD